jgi:hypothetical protein
MSILKDLGRVSTETKTEDFNSITSNADVGDPFTGPNSPRYCHNGSACVEIFVVDGKTKVDGNVFSLRSSDCKNADLSATVNCSFVP